MIVYSTLEEALATLKISYIINYGTDVFKPTTATVFAPLYKNKEYLLPHTWTYDVPSNIIIEDIHKHLSKVYGIVKVDNIGYTIK